MQVKRLTPDLAVGPQLAADDVATLAALGFRAIIASRPDGEAADQPAFAELGEEATTHGLQTRHLPVVASRIGESDIAAFRAALRDLPKPMFAFCRTGTRAALLWALANGDTLTADERIRMAAAHGFDLAAFRDRIAAAG